MREGGRRVGETGSVGGREEGWWLRQGGTKLGDRMSARGREGRWITEGGAMVEEGVGTVREGGRSSS